VTRAWNNPERVPQWFYTWRRLMVLCHLPTHLYSQSWDADFDVRQTDAGYCLDRYDGGLVRTLINTEE
jgi:hypothetical protein